MFYREKILEIYKNPRHFESLATFNLEAEKENPFCGDRLKVRIKLKNGLIEKIGFTGEGCVLTIVGASMAGDLVLGQRVEKVATITLQDILRSLKLQKILPSREKCLTLGLTTLKEAYLQNKRAISRKEENESEFFSDNQGFPRR